MKRILIPVDGSEASLQAVRTAVREAALAPVRLELVNVQPRFHRHISDRVPAGLCRGWREARARSVLRAAERIAADGGVEFRSHAVVGPVAPRLLWCARTLRADEILVGAVRRGALGRWLANSVSSRLLEASPVPVRIVPGPAAPLLDRLALPAGLGLVALLLLADE